MIEYVAMFLLAVAALVLLAKYMAAARQVEALRDELTALRSEFAFRVSGEAGRMFREWREKEIKDVEQQIRSVLEKEYAERLETARKQLELDLKSREKEIRLDAVKRSVSVILGKAGEYIAPLLFLPRLGADPRDVRYIGTPVDYIVFKGLGRGELDEIVFVEVKTGRKPALNDREKMVKRVVDAGRVRWVTFHLANELEKIRNEIDVV